MIIDTDKIQKLLNSNLTSYRAAQITNVKQPVYYRYQKRQTPIENMTLKVASEIMKIINLEEKSMYTLKIEEEGKLQTVENFNNFEDLKNHLITTDYFSWINDNEPDRELPDFTDVEDVEDINDILEDYDYSWWTAEVEERELTKEDLKNMELYFSWYNPEDGTTDLGFGPKGDIILRRVETPENVDEFYWDEPENVIKAIDEADENDIEEK